jgi:RHS repeat-associated protein
LNSNGETYDALDRRVEQYNGSAYTEIVYGPAGNKMALMSGQTVTKVFAPLSAGATAVYNSSGLAYYRHPDWLGSSRVASTTSRTLYYDGAYAPFGESYAETGTTDRNFTGQNQDLTPASTGDLYDFLYREYHKIQGRWVSPDPAGASAADPTNPQSWNRYSYVSDRPLTSTDPLGLWIWSVGNCFYDTVGAYVDGEFQGYDTQLIGCFSSQSPVGTVSFQGTVGGGGYYATKPSIDCSHQPSLPPQRSTPAGASITANEQSLTAEMQAEASASQLISGTPPAAPPGLGWWLSKVAPDVGAWDYIHNNSTGTRQTAFGSFGNVNYGATCNVLGLTLSGCQQGAGAAASLSSGLNMAFGSGKSTSGPGNPLGQPSFDNGMPVYGDQTGGFENQSVIAGWGYAAWQHACGW